MPPGGGEGTDTLAGVMSGSSDEVADAGRQGRRDRVLFVAEGVTLAHVGRPAALAACLQRSQYEVHFACARKYQDLVGRTLAMQWHDLASISSEVFLGRLATGRPVYTSAELRRYVQDDLALLGALRPDVVVGDFRLSLGISAELSGVPYITLTNAYWSPFARGAFPVPDLPLTRLVGLRVASAVFRFVRPMAFALHALPMHRLRRAHGLSGLGLDLPRTYTHADYTLYADIPELAPTRALPATHGYLGPVTWSPSVVLPPWWGSWPPGRDRVYVTLGSSGRSDLLGTVLAALADLPVVVLAATAGRAPGLQVPANAFVADYLPGDQVAAVSRLVVCNGGSPCVYQALGHGVPVLGVVTNMDQLLNMRGVVNRGAGVLLRASDSTPGRIRHAVRHVLDDPRFADAARQLAETIRHYRACERFAGWITKALARARGAAPPAEPPGC